MIGKKKPLNPPDSDLIYDWNRAGGDVFPSRGVVEIDDETLRDGLQSPSVKSPSIDQKIRILHLMEALGIDSVDIGLPGVDGKRYSSGDFDTEILVIVFSCNHCPYVQAYEDRVMAFQR